MQDNGVVWNAAVLPLLLMVWSLAVKYVPKLASWPNAIIPWLNMLLAFLVRLATPTDAHAAGVLTTVTASIGWLWPPLQTVIAAQLYERFVRPWFEHFGIGKALPAGGHAPAGDAAIPQEKYSIAKEK